MKILVAALQCGLTRVANINIPVVGAYNVLQLLDAAKVGTFSLLDNSVVYWGMQYGVGVRLNPHTGNDMSVMVAGGAGGKLAQGNYISYLNTRDNARICTDSSLNCMGLSSADYETTTGLGYGYYRTAPGTDGKSIKRLGPNMNLNQMPRGGFYGTTAGRRTPLPGFYQGPVMG